MACFLLRHRNTLTKIQFNEADLAICSEKLAQLRQQVGLKTTAADELVAEIGRLEGALAVSAGKLGRVRAAIKCVSCKLQ